ncbi:MAG: aldehyde ferredoxin oxidoreductase family protein [Pseudomonadota bacterium]
MSNATGKRLGRGYVGRILHVDLTAGQTQFESLEDDFYKKYLSGVGLGAKILWDRMKPGADPLGPDNILGFTTGLLTDTGSVFSGRFTVVGKSPTSGGWGDANCGGSFSPWLKRCGVDAVFFHGQSPRPVYLYLDSDKVEIRDAASLWGLDAIETEKKIKDLHGKTAQVACIGPAGEKLSLMAGIANDGGRYAARSGLGAVMGSKRLKAVVAAGKNRPGAADPDRMAELTKAFRKRLEKGKFMQRVLGDKVIALVGWITRTSPAYTRQPAELFRQILLKYGTAGLTAMSAEAGDSPVKNWGGVGYRDFPLSRSMKIGAESVTKFEVKKYGCYSCPIRCGGIMKIEDGPFPIEEMHKPEYETLCAFGTMTLTDDLPTIMKLNDLVNRGGVDSISCGAVAAFAIECFENGILTTADTGGLELRWGDSQALLRLTEMIIARRGLGDLLADGVKIAAQRIGRGAEKFAVHCGGVEPAMHDPKFDPGFAAAYHCEPTPGRHTITSLQYLDLQELDKRFKRAKKAPLISTHQARYRYDDKGEDLMVGSFFKMIIDGCGLCLFGTQVGGNMPLAEWINAAAGWDLTNDDYLKIGERIHLLRHSFNVREGLNPIKDFRPHPRIQGDPPQDKGPAKGVTIDLDQMAKSIYRACRWDLADGRPELVHLQNMGLEEVAEAFYPR